MVKKTGSFLALVLLLIGTVFFCLLPVKSYAYEEDRNSPATVLAATEKTPTADPSILPHENGELINKQQAIQKPVSRNDNNADTVSREPLSKKNGKMREAEQDVMERALELISISQEYWVSGDIENALDILDQAYAILLDTNGDVEISRQKDDLRLLISKKILAIYTSKQTVTTGTRSEVPVVMNGEVEREIRSFQTGERDFFMSSYQRASFFRPTIVDALKKAGLPEELSWLPLVESGFKIRALSKARALGLWQFIPSTGYKYGLNRDDWVDERMDVEKSTQSAIGYLKDLHDMFGDWLTVLAAYNCGEGRVLRVISGQHINYLDRFWDLYNQLPNETARYVPRFLATLHIIRDPQRYGFNFESPAEKQPAYAYSRVTTNKCMNLQDIAGRIDLSEELLCTLNAELRHQKTPDKEYGLKIPPEYTDKLVNVLDEIPQADKPRASDSRRVALIRHKVKNGETVEVIAQRYKTTASAIKSYNKQLAKSGVKAGSRLVIPIRSNSTVKVSDDREANNKKAQSTEEFIKYKVKRGDTIFSLAKRYDMTVPEVKKLNNMKGDTLKSGNTLKFIKKSVAHDEKNQKAGRAQDGIAMTDKYAKAAVNEQPVKKTYVVRKGDNLITIAQRNGSNVEKLMQLNKFADKDNIQPGQVIVVR